VGSTQYLAMLWRQATRSWLGTHDSQLSAN
jgi:hypothetical protein